MIRMASIVDGILSADDILYLNSLSYRHHGASSTFFIELTDSIRSALSPLGMDLSNTAKIPMRWIHGDTAAHSDVGATPFTKTILVYLNDSTGEFIVGDTAHPIKANTAFVFDEGIPHRTVGTEPRLVMGPMSERAEPVGSPIAYFANEADALSNTNPIGYTGSYTLETVGGFSNWMIASNSDGSSPQNVPYAAGSVLNNDGGYSLYPAVVPPPVSGPVFVFDSPQVQRAANTVYDYKTTYDTAALTAGSQKVYTFKTDRERMQYLMGKYNSYSRGLTPG